MAKISIIVPVYNVEKYLKECLNSLINQTFKDIEIICINDGSNDNSLKILEEYQSRDSRIKVFSQENSGQGIARNKGIDVAQGEYLMFVDPDDYIELNTCELLNQKIIETNASVVRFDYKILNEANGNIKYKYFADDIKKNGYKHNLKKHKCFNWRNFKDKFLPDMHFIMLSQIVSRSFINENNLRFTSGRYGEDQLFFLGAILKTDIVYYINECLYVYRQRIDSATRHSSPKNFCVFENLNLFKDFLIQNDLFAELEHTFYKYKLMQLMRSYKLIPIDMQEEYKLKCKNVLNDKEYKKFISIIRKNDNSFLENIFSIKNLDLQTKIITILGIEIKIPRW